MSYADDWALSQSTALQQQVQMSVFKTALFISNEPATTHPNLDSKRRGLADSVLRPTGGGFGLVSGPFNMQFVWSAIESGLTGTPTDAEVDTAIFKIWNELAGVSFRDLENL